MGTEAFWIPAVISAVSAGGEAVNQSNAAKRQDNAEAGAIANQEQLRQKAVGQVSQATQQLSQENPNALKQQAVGDYVQQLRRNAAGSTQGGSTSDGATTFGAPTSSLAPSVKGGSRYGTDTAKAQKEVQNFGNTYAGEMGGIDAATRQRENEGLNMQTLGTNLNTLGAASYGQNFVDQLRAQASGQANPWVSLFAGMAKNGANAYAAGADPVPSYGKAGKAGKGVTADSGLSSGNWMNS